MYQNRLLKEVFAWPEDYVAALGADVVHQLKKWPVVVNVPKQVRKKDEKSGERRRARSIY